MRPSEYTKLILLHSYVSEIVFSIENLNFISDKELVKYYSISLISCAFSFYLPGL